MSIQIENKQTTITQIKIKKTRKNHDDNRL